MTMDQIRAQYAWERLGQGRRAGSREYRNLAKGMPALVMTNGLLQALAFLKSKGRPEHDWLFQDIVDWLAHSGVGVLAGAGCDWGQATESLTALDPAEYRRATEEALAILKWIRQFADARGGEG